jgi:regulator of replication initiation timing
MAATLTLRSVKGSPLTNTEVDDNFTNLNSEITTLETDVGTLQTDLNTAEGEIDTLQSEVSALQTATGANLPETIADVVGNMVTSNTESGISVVYQDGDNTLDFDVNDFTITVNGDATGAATITNLGSQTLTLDISSITGNLAVSGDVDAANFNTTSDISLKENLNIIESPLDKINQLNGYTFNWKENKKEAIGIVAQEVEKIFPELVVAGRDGVKRVNYDSLIPVMLEAIKELAKR